MSDAFDFWFLSVVTLTPLPNLVVTYQLQFVLQISAHFNLSSPTKLPISGELQENLSMTKFNFD